MLEGKQSIVMMQRRLIVRDRQDSGKEPAYGRWEFSRLQLNLLHNSKILS